MASALYPAFKELLLGGDIDLAADTIKAALVRTSAYTYSAAHDFLDDVPTRVADSPAMSGKTITDGVFDADDTTWTAVASGAAADAIVLYKDTGNPATSPLVAYIDGVSQVPNGGDIVAQWNASGIFAL